MFFLMYLDVKWDISGLMEFSFCVYSISCTVMA